MLYAEQLLYETEKNSHQRFSIRMLCLKILQYSWENFGAYAVYIFNPYAFL